jgi:hypothetical protein
VNFLFLLRGDTATLAAASFGSARIVLAAVTARESGTK